MLSLRTCCGYFPVIVMVGNLCVLPDIADAECRISEFADKYEVVCTGKPLTADEKKALEDEEKAREAERKAKEKKEMNMAAVKADQKPAKPGDRLSRNNKDNQMIPRTIRDRINKKNELLKQPVSRNTSQNEVTP